MNLRELNLQGSFFNSQLQLNNDWFVSKDKTSSNFDTILKDKSVKSSDVEPKREYKGLTNRTMNQKVSKDLKKERTHFDQRRDLSELKESIREGIAQRKLKKETGNNGKFEQLEHKLEQLNKLKEKIENLEEAIRDEIGLPDDTEVLDLMASLMGINVEELILQLTTDQYEMVPVEILGEQLTELLTSEEVNLEVLVDQMETIVEKMPAEKLEVFQDVLQDVVEQIDLPEVKEALQPLMEAIDFKLTEAVETPEIVVEEVAVQAETVKPVETQISTVDATEVKTPETTEMPQQPVEAKEEAPKQEMQMNQQSKPIMNELVKQAPKEEVKVNFGEQVNLMKSENSLITSAKIQPKGVVARSVMNQVIQGTKMSINMSDQGQEILIKLNPKNLGNVALKMAFDKGVLLAEIQVENQTVKGVIESNLEDLRNALRDEGYSIGNLDVSVNKENTGQEERNFGQQVKKQAKVESFEEVEEKLLQENLVNDKEVNYLA